jgi:RNA polymerase sigma factor (sigma-70 family)
MFDDATHQSIKAAASVFLRRSHSQRLNMDRDDLIQELTLHVIQKSHAYDPALGAWATFVNCIVKRKLSLIRRSFKSQRNRINVEATSLDEGKRSNSGTTLDYLNALEQASSPRKKSEEFRSETEIWERRVDVETVVQKLEPQQQIFCRQLIEHQTSVESCRSLGVSRSTYYRQLKEIREVFIESCVTRSK